MYLAPSAAAEEEHGILMYLPSLGQMNGFAEPPVRISKEDKIESATKAVSHYVPTGHWLLSPELLERFEEAPE